MNLTEQLEILIDENGLSEVLTTISESCSEKAEHIRENYGADDTDANRWDKSAQYIETCAGNVKKYQRL